MWKHFDQLNTKLAKELFGLNKPIRKKKKERKIWLWGIMAAILFLAATGIFFVKDYSSQKIASIQLIPSELSRRGLPIINQIFPKKLPDEFTLLFLGIPGGDNKAPYLTDSIILFNYQDNRLTAFSLPRDLLVKIPESDYFTKLNALYILDKQNQKQPYLITQKIEEISGLTIDFYIVVDLELVKNLIDIVGGVNILVAQDIYDPKFPGPNNSYQTFELPAGWRYLDGETALKYIRTRFSPGGDFDRIDRQQQLLLAIKKKIFSLNPLTSLPELIKIYQNLKDRLETNLHFSQGLSLVNLLENLEEENIRRFSVDKERGLLIDSEALLGNERVYVLIPTMGEENYQEIREFIAKKIEN